MTMLLLWAIRLWTNPRRTSTSDEYHPPSLTFECAPPDLFRRLTTPARCCCCCCCCCRCCCHHFHGVTAGFLSPRPHLPLRRHGGEAVRLRRKQPAGALLLLHARTSPAAPTPDVADIAAIATAITNDTGCRFQRGRPRSVEEGGPCPAGHWRLGMDEEVRVLAGVCCGCGWWWWW